MIVLDTVGIIVHYRGLLQSNVITDVESLGEGQTGTAVIDE